MTQERELARTTNVAELPAPQDVDLAPGRTSWSAKLTAPANPLISGLILRKAERDGNGVANDAGTALASASATSGATLPKAIQRKFESSLGADLSNVRVHTGGESQAAAHAVGAKAYTIGQDIHFGAGHYDPTSRAGEHLLAHEVAHTVQQHGGAPARQNKLEVSSPGDAFEHEADAAADAMVGGASAKVGVAPGGVARVKALTDAADQGGQAMEEGLKESGAPVTTISNVNDKATANQVLNTIRGANGDIQQGIATKQIDASCAIANTQAENMLSDYVQNAEGQTSQISTFQGLYTALMKDFGRLNGMMGVLDGSSLGSMKDEAGAEKRGQDQGKEIFNFEDAQKETTRVENIDPTIKTKLDGMKIKKAQLTTQGQQIITKSNDVASSLTELSNKQRDFLAAANSVVSPEAQQALADAKKRAANDYSKAAGDALKGALIGAIGGLKEGPMGAAKGAASGAGKSVWETTIKPGLDKALEDANISVGEFPNNKAEADQVAKDQAAWGQAQAKAQAVTAQRDVVRQKTDAMGTEVTTYQQQRDLYENEMIELGQEMDKTAKIGRGPMPKNPCSCDDKDAPKPAAPADKGPRYETAMQFLAEADRFIAQADVVTMQGTKELEVKPGGHNTASQAHDALVKATTGAGRPDFFYTVVRAPAKNADGKEFVRLWPQRNNFTLHNGLNPSQPIDGGPDETHQAGSAEGNDGMGANSVIADSMKRVEDVKKKVTAYRTKLASTIGV